MASSKLAERFLLSHFAYAHRGLWATKSYPENSLEACLEAAKQALGIEFDVRPSRDGSPVIFHDPTLDRMVGQSGLVEETKLADLCEMPLKGGGKIISLQQLLEVWPGQTPLLCEMKIDGQTDPEAFAKTVSEMLNAYSGPAAAMSFSHKAVLALPEDLMRGQLLDPFLMSGVDIFQRDLDLALKGPADYIACHAPDTGRSELQQARQSKPLIAWTVKNAEVCKTLAPLTDSQIFENFDPDLAKSLILSN